MAAQWTLEKVAGEAWTLRRDSPKTAFNVHVWNEGDAGAAGTVRLPASHERLDVVAGDSIDVEGVSVGCEVIIDWVEGDRRLAARARIRESTQVVTLLRKDATPFARGW